ncbi:hypothetical protein [Candidatus Uabimicrobium sp. HlEnr_7]|uniref:hypothetical protein n=1 Tax=Candidatus Uabimicrobium helgolandensis TaxID=3095367 RepID=UPI003557369C
MIISYKEITVHCFTTRNLQANTTKSQIIVRYSKLNFTKYIDMQDSHNSKHKAFKELNELAFTEFRCGRFILESQEKQDRALNIIRLNDKELIELVYSKDPFEQYLIKRELKERNLFDRDIYYMGFYGIDIAKQYAIDMLKEKIRISPQDKLPEPSLRNSLSLFAKIITCRVGIIVLIMMYVLYSLALKTIV